MKRRNRLTAFLLALVLVLTTAAGSAPLRVCAEESTEGTSEGMTESATGTNTGSTGPTAGSTEGNTSEEGTEEKPGSEDISVCTLTEGCTLQEGHEGECVLPEEPAGDGTCSYKMDDVTAGDDGIIPTAGEGDADAEPGTQANPWNISADEGENNVTAYMEQNNSGVGDPTYTLTISGDGNMKDFEKTKSSDNRPWKDYDEQITEVIIEGNLVNIGECAFYDFYELKKIVLPQSLKSIGKQAFCNCISLSEVNFTDLTNLTEIGENSFRGVITDTVDLSRTKLTQIPKQAFIYVEMSKLTLPDTLVSIGFGAFSRCLKLVEVAFPPSLEKIETSAFNWCGALEKVDFTGLINLETIGSQTFTNTKLKHVDLSDCESLKEFNSFTFTGSPNGAAESILLPDGILTATTDSGGENNILTAICYVDGNADCSTLKALASAKIGFTSIIPYRACLDGGFFPEKTVFEKDVLAAPVKEGSIFEGWYTKDAMSGNWGIKVTSPVSDQTCYAKWSELTADSITLTYDETKSLDDAFQIPGGIYSNWKSTNDKIVTIQNGMLKATGVGTAVITDGANEVTVKIEPMRIIYGPSEKQLDGRPYIVYALNENGTAPLLSDLLGFYPVKEGIQEGTFEPDMDKGKIKLTPSMANTGDVEYTYENDASGNTITTDTLPIHPTVDAVGNPHSIRVELKLKNPNYAFCTVGTGWKPKDTIILYVACYEKDMKEVELWLKGDDAPLKTFEGDCEFEYTGEGIVPTNRDLTTLYTKGTNTNNTITTFNAHFHAVEEGSTFAGEHLDKVPNTGLTAEALKGIAPRELGVYSFVINGYNKGTKTYCYASRRYSIVKGNPKGEPVFEKAESAVELSTITLSGTMKNASGIEVEGTLSWDDGSQTVTQGTAYAWTFTPNDAAHYNSVAGTSIVWPEKEPGGDTKPDTGEDNDDSNNSGHHGGGSGSGSSGSSSKPAGVKGAKTGDETSPLPFVLLSAALGGIVLCGYAMSRRKKGNAGDFND